MSGHRFFAENFGAQSASVHGEEYAHLKRVLRLREGDAVIAMDGKGAAYEAVIAKMGAEAATLTLGEKLPPNEPRCHVTLYQALPKADKLDWILQKGTELGACRFVLLETLHCVKRPKDMEKKLERYLRIAREAAKQCGRAIEPAVEGPLKIKGLRQENARWILLDEMGGLPLSDCLENAPEDIGVFIGPEGGWAEEERAALMAMGARTATLGSRILRTETAGMAALSAIMYAQGEFA